MNILHRMRPQLRQSTLDLLVLFTHRRPRAQNSPLPGLPTAWGYTQLYTLSVYQDRHRQRHRHWNRPLRWLLTTIPPSTSTMNILSGMRTQSRQLISDLLVLFTHRSHRELESPLTGLPVRSAFIRTVAVTPTLNSSDVFSPAYLLYQQRFSQI